MRKSPTKFPKACIDEKTRCTQYLRQKKIAEKPLARDVEGEMCTPQRKIFTPQIIVTLSRKQMVTFGHLLSPHLNLTQRRLLKEVHLLFFASSGTLMCQLRLQSKLNIASLCFPGKLSTPMQQLSSNSKQLYIISLASPNDWNNGLATLSLHSGCLHIRIFSRWIERREENHMSSSFSLPPATSPLSMIEFKVIGGSHVEMNLIH